MIRFEGPCVYARETARGFEIIAYSTNSVTHLCIGTEPDPVKAERLCRRLNAYPVNTRRAFELL